MLRATNTADEQALTPNTALDMSGFVVRSPLLPASDVIDLGTELVDVDWTSDEEYAKAIDRIRERLRRLISRSEVIEALFVASPSLVESIPIWLSSPTSARARKVERAIVKYLERMSTRATPFGLFSGCSVGQFDDRTKLELEGRGSYRRHSRLDMDYLFALAETLNRDEEVRARTLFRPNDTIVALGERYRYVEPQVRTARKRHYALAAVDATPYLRIVLERSSTGARIEDLIGDLVRYDPELTESEAREYLAELVDAHLLVSDLQPPVTGREAGAEIAARLKHASLEKFVEPLEKAALEIARLDAKGVGNPISSYRQVAGTLAALPAPVDMSRLVQVDMNKVGSLTLGPRVRQDVERCAALMARFGSSVDLLSDFRSAFEKRYGTATVPLLHVLDEEAGIGLGRPSLRDASPFLEGLQLANGAAQDGRVSWDGHHGWLLQRLYDVWRGVASEIVVGDGDVEHLFAGRSALPSVRAFSVGFTIAACSAEAIDRGEYHVLLRGVSGPSGARLLGRFCHVDAEIHALVKEHVESEERLDPDAVFAEVVHLPEGRLGNIILRPTLREYDLTFMGCSGAPPDRQIPVSDLLVTVRANRTLLWSERLGRRVVPRLTSAHNAHYTGNLAPYRFLAALQTEGIRSGLGFSWGPLANAPYLPRIRWGRCVLSRAAWRCSSNEVRETVGLSPRSRFVAARAWAQARGVPRLAELSDGDNELLVDFGNPVSVDAFLDLVDGRPSFVLTEVYPGPDELCLRGPEGRFTHEIYVPVVESPSPSQGVGVGFGPPVLPRASVRARRNAAPGAEWMFAKVFGGPAELDDVLSEVVTSVVAEAIGTYRSERWFFLRYSDPDYHLRLRFRGNAGVLHGGLLVLLNRLIEPRIENGTLGRFHLDVYQPELERYGGPVGLDLSEQVFQADSEAVIELLGWLKAEALGEEVRLQLALKGLDSMIDDFGFSWTEKCALVRRRRDSYASEFRADSSPLKHQLGTKFRSLRRWIEASLSRENGIEGPFTKGSEVWARRSSKLQPLVAGLRAAESRGDLSVPVGDLIDSYLHLYVNRVSRVNARAHEFVMFDLLNRYCESREGRLRRASAST